MKIDWKHLSTTTGYKSLKAAYVDDLKNSRRGKDELIRKFRWVISRATHYSFRNNVSIEKVLNEWEEKRGYWWLNYYTNGNQPKATSSSIKPMGLRGFKKSISKNSLISSKYRKFRVMELIRNQQEKESTKKNKRWTAQQKLRGY